MTEENISKFEAAARENSKMKYSEKWCGGASLSCRPTSCI